MANAITFGFWLVIYEVLVFIIVGLLSIGGVLGDSGITSNNPTMFSSDYAVPLNGNTGKPITCSGNGSISLDLDAVLLFTYVPSETTLSSECATYCKDESVPPAIYGYSCQGYCVNLTLANGRPYASCNNDPTGFFGMPDWIVFLISFYTFQLDLGLGLFNWIIPLIFVFIPVGLGLGLVTISYLRGTS